MSDFVTIKKDEFEDYLDKDYKIIDLPNVMEFVYQIPTDNARVGVRIYSSVDKRTGVTRDIGKDAIRVIYWDVINDRPIGKDRRINRVEGATTIGQRLKERIDFFKSQAIQQEVIDFGYVKFILQKNDWSTFAVSLLDQVNQRGSLSEKQLEYVLGNTNPKGKRTFEAMAREKNPGLNEEYILMNGGTDDDETNIKTTKKNNMDAERERESIQKKEKKIESVEVDIEPVSTEGCNYKFDFFNPVQSRVFPIRNKDINVIIGANTSAGKTICAELCMDETLKQNKRVIYLSPLKALTQEKYEDWQVRYPDENICIMTGDYVLSNKKKQELSDSRIIVMTSEMCDSRTRKFHSEKNYWMNQVGLVIVDESHILTTERGHAVESGLMRFSRLNPSARILLLSATMPNCDELADWLTVLNNKNTEVIFSKWRPVVLNMNYVEYPIAYYANGNENYWANQTNKMNKALSCVYSKPDEKFLVFVHDKGTGRKIVDALEREGIEAKFHSADLKLEERLEIETSFAKKKGGLRVLVSTSTLAWGRNLPARNVVIVGVHRGINEVDSLDIIQMAGRAGRYGIDDAGFVYLVIPEFSTELWEHTFENPRPVRSVMNEAPTLAFHMLAEIQTKNIKDRDTAFTWYERSLAYLQEQKYADFSNLSEDHITEIFGQLKEMDMIRCNGGYLKTTGLGDVSAWMYFSPYDTYNWFKNFNEIIEGDIQRDDFSLAWALSDIPTNQTYITRDVQDDANNMVSELRSRNINPNIKAMMSVMASYNCLTQSELGNGAIQAMERTIKFDSERICSALKLIDARYASWKADFIDTLALRVKHGVSEQIVELTKLNKIGGKRALKLSENGILTLKDVINPKNKTKLHKVVNPALAKAIVKQAKELLEV